MTCPLCGVPDSVASPQHYTIHQIEALRRIAKALEALGDILEEKKGSQA